MKKTVFLVLLALLFSTGSAYGEDLERIGPFSDQRSTLIPTESFFNRHQYWTSSVVQNNNTPLFLATTRATSMETGINHDLIITISGKDCTDMYLFIMTDRGKNTEYLENQFGQMLFVPQEGKFIEHNVRFDTAESSSYDAFYFKTKSINTLISLMKKHQSVIINLPSVKKKTIYDLRGFSAALKRAENMCLGSR